jgi:hypothetical protein
MKKKDKEINLGLTTVTLDILKHFSPTKMEPSRHPPMNQEFLPFFNG